MILFEKSPTKSSHFVRVRQEVGNEDGFQNYIYRMSGRYQILNKTNNKRLRQ